MASISSSDYYPVTVSIEAYEQYKSQPWCHIITARIEDPNTHTQVAHAVAYLIERMEIEHNTDDQFDIFELSSTAEELFYDEIFYHDITMEHFVLWHEVVVEPEYRKQGLGRKIVTAVHDKAREHLGHWFYGLAAPGFLGSEMEREGMREDALGDAGKMLEIQRRQFDTAVRFWTAIGYGKFGASKFHVRRAA